MKLNLAKLNSRSKNDRSNDMLQQVTPIRDRGTDTEPSDLNRKGLDDSYFATSLSHVLAEMERIALLVRMQLRQARQVAESGDQFRGLVISEEEVDEILNRPAGALPFSAASETVDANRINEAIGQLNFDIVSRREESVRRGVELRLVELQQIFELSAFDLDCLLICLVAELDPRYERLYSYLQDDVTRKYASVNLIMNLLCQSFEEKLHQRERFAAEAPLLGRGLLLIHDEPSRGSEALLGKYLRVDERITRYLLGSDQCDGRIQSHIRVLRPAKSFDDLFLPTGMKRVLSALTEDRSAAASSMLVYMQGSYGCGRKAAAEALCRASQLKLIHVDLESVLGHQAVSADAAIALIVREGLLQRGALHIEDFDLLLADDKTTLRKKLLRELSRSKGLIFLAGATSWEPRGETGESEFIALEFPRTDYPARVELWRKELAGLVSPDFDFGILANKFRLTGGQIKDSVTTARRLAMWREGESRGIEAVDIYEACRVHSSRKLSSLGRKIKPHHAWEDIVLPEDRLQQLREICNSMKYRSLVFDQWGFDRKLSLGKGLNILFAGPSGTGKTMAAEIMAGELGLDLYKIDLSTVVSKYIGETEKNLARIFSEAETSNAILFFDEADALFGKRSEVRDSHDRYANIEINYLLQKMEEHEGVVILATNFRKNMDDAFVRRMHFTVEFAFPNESDRRRIWEQIWPKETPQSPDLDFDFMARRFEVPGGNIRNIAMAAAFLAASDGGIVNMAHLLHGTRREYQKMGKVVKQGEFK
jgi:ATP-dependent 26S proteasome regulatory subunit